MKPHEILVEAAETFKTRNAVYKDNYKHIGPVMAGYFPKGIQLLTPTDYIRFHLFMLIHVKLTRYTNNWANGHQDSLRDISVYAAMLESVDTEELGEFPQSLNELDNDKINSEPEINMYASDVVVKFG